MGRGVSMVGVGGGGLEGYLGPCIKITRTNLVFTIGQIPSK